MRLLCFHVGLGVLVSCGHALLARWQQLCFHRLSDPFMTVHGSAQGHVGDVARALQTNPLVELRLGRNSLHGGLGEAGEQELCDFVRRSLIVLDIAENKITGPLLPCLLERGKHFRACVRSAYVSLAINPDVHVWSCGLDSCPAFGLALLTNCVLVLQAASSQNCMQVRNSHRMPQLKASPCDPCRPCRHADRAA